jgi:hypothetical protein
VPQKDIDHLRLQNFIIKEKQKIFTGDYDFIMWQLKDPKPGQIYEMYEPITIDAKDWMFSAQISTISDKSEMPYLQIFVKEDKSQE